LTIAIVDYECGNTGSIANMLRHLGANAKVTRENSELQRASGIILPGVGSFDTGIEKLLKFGLDKTLSTLAHDDRKPVLGVCLGAQLMTKSSEEGKKLGMGWVDAVTKRFQFDDSERPLPIPHMGWSFVSSFTEDQMCAGFDEFTKFYFVHSYHFELHDEDIALINSHYGYSFPAAFKKGNVVGVQFHPEKSHRHGMNLMKNFLALCKECSPG
jgi:glutamine amidotransferase